MRNIKNIILSFVALFLIAVLCTYGESGWGLESNIFFQIRLPKVLVCIFSGAMLSIAGLLMQIFFQNPIAGPDILGVSAGASLFSAIWIMASSLLPISFFNLGLNISAFLGSWFVFLILILFSRKTHSRLTLLILGILISSFAASLVAILVNSSPALQVKNYLLWSQGTFRNLTKEEIPTFITLSVVSLLPIFYFKKTMQLYMLGENYAHSLGLNIKKSARVFVIFTSLFVSLVTVYCGPIGFIGIIGPHLAKKIIGRSTLDLVLPATILIGIVLTLVAELVVTVFSQYPLTINSILGLIGAPVLIYYVIKSRELSV